MIKQEKRTVSRKTNKKNTAVKAVLILTIMCCLLSTIAHASNIEITSKNVTAIVMYGYDSTLTTESWRTVSISIEDNNVKTEFISYGQTQQRLHFNVNGMEYKNINIETIFQANNIGNIGITYLYIVFTDNTHTEVNCTITKIQNNKYKINGESNGNNKIIREIRLYTRFEIVSTVVNYSELKITINDEVYKIVNELENTINQIENGQEDAIRAINPNSVEGMLSDLQNILDNTFNGISEYSNNSLNAIFYSNIFSGSSVIQLVMMISMTLTIVSYIIFGKYK